MTKVTKVIEYTNASGEKWWEVQWQTWFGWKTQTRSNGKLGTSPVIYVTEEAAITEAKRISNIYTVVAKDIWCSHEKKEAWDK